MFRLIAVIAGLFLISASPSFAQMMDQMEKHMGGQMGGMNKQEARTEARGLAQETEAAGVTVKAVYKNPGEEGPVFLVALDTHTADLEGYRFEDIVVLRDDAGNEYRPQAVTEKGSGHHREALLEFKDAIPASAKTLDLVVKGVAGVDERVFKFDLRNKTGK
ncbi:MAG: hypothetical protein HY956_01860 [Deltaproteobacteria bacterium]|nr:hypothetical protein [Deltaproteobacteria bacterium]